MIHPSEQSFQYGKCIMLLKDFNQLLLYVQLFGTSLGLLYLMKGNSMLAIWKYMVLSAFIVPFSVMTLQKVHLLTSLLGSGTKSEKVKEHENSLYQQRALEQMVS